MKARGKKLKRTKRKRGPRIAFGELVRKLWQPEPEVAEPKGATEKLKKPAGKSKRGRKN